MKVQSKISLLSLYRGEIRLWRVTGAYGTCLNLRILFYESTSTHRSIRRIIFLCEVLSSYPRSVNKRIRSLDIFEKCVEKKHTAATAVYAVHRPLRPSPPLADKNPLSRVKYVRDETASRDNSKLCLLSSLRPGPALPPSRASPFCQPRAGPRRARHSSTILPIRSWRVLRCLMQHVVSRRRFTIRFGSIHRSKQLWIIEGGSVSKRW